MPFLFFKLPPYDLIYDDPNAFQQLRLHFRIRLSSRGFKTEKVVVGGGGWKGGLQEGEGHLIRLIPTHTSAAGARGSRASSPCECATATQTPWLLCLLKGKLENMVPWHIAAGCSVLPLALAGTEEAAFLRVGWNESPRGARWPEASSA